MVIKYSTTYRFHISLGNLLSLKDEGSNSTSAFLSVFRNILTPNLEELSMASNFLTVDEVLKLLAPDNIE